MDSYNGWMRLPRLGRYGAIEVAVWVAIIAFSPVIVLAGEPVNRYVMRWRQAHWAAPATQVAISGSGGGQSPLRISPPASLIFTALSNSLWIALTAPGRWMGDRFASPPRPRGRVSAS